MKQRAFPNDVVFARSLQFQLTDGSDIDWILLIDGLADPKHHDLCRKIGRIIDGHASKKPSVEGMFGAMVFGHMLVNLIPR